jgi:hypothetical protein
MVDGTAACIRKEGRRGKRALFRIVIVFKRENPDDLPVREESLGSSSAGSRNPALRCLIDDDDAFSNSSFFSPHDLDDLTH